MGPVLFTDVVVLDASGAEPFPGEVLVAGNRIRTVARGYKQIARDQAARVVDGHRVVGVRDRDEAVVALTEVTDFRHRLRHDDVLCVGLGKRGGHGARLYPALWRLLRQHRPAVVHTRNLGALEMQVAAWAAAFMQRPSMTAQWSL